MSQPTLRTVSVLFCDLVDSVGLASRLSEHAYYDRILGPFYKEAEQVITGHGGKVRPAIAGDKVLGVFGVPVEQPDDAIRAVEAAVALRAKVAELSRQLQDDWDVSLEVHTGVNSGNALVQKPNEDPTAVFGDAVNIGARLQDAAAPGEILLGDGTHRLAVDFVLAEPVPLTIRGRRAPFTAWRLSEVQRRGVTHGTRVAAPLVGRELELSHLHWAYQRVLRESTCHVVNVLGLAGVGKSRLVYEFLRALDSTPKILRGHCQPYGPGITYRPIRQLVQQAADVDPDHTQDRVRELVMEVVGHERTTDKIMRLFGAPDRLLEREETFRGVQRMFESMARRRPLVIVIEDLHAAQPASLDAIGWLIDSLRDSRILIICMARSEFLDEGGILGSSSPNVHNLSVYPLPEGEVGQLVGHLLRGGEPPEELHELAAWTGGNPFYLEELVTNLVEAELLRLRGGRWVMHGDLLKVPPPPRIGAVLGARLTRLGDAEREVIHRAAVIGTQFTTAGVLAVLPEELDPEAVPAILEGLVQRQLLVHDSSMPPRSGEDADAFVFKHILIQEAAYRRVDKATRSDVHRRYADWLERTEPSSAALLEQIGFHLDTAYQDRAEELGREDDEASELARRAGEFLARAGQQHVRQGNFPNAAIDALLRAVELLPEDHRYRPQALLDLAEALRDAGDAGARSAFAYVQAAAGKAGETRIEMHAVVGRLEIEWFQRSYRGWEQGRLELDRAIVELERLADDLGLAKAYRLSAHTYMGTGELEKASRSTKRAFDFVRHTDQVRLEAKIRRLYCLILFWGPTPLDEVVRENERALEWARARGMFSLEAFALETLARAAAMGGDFAEARRLREEARNLIPDLGELLTTASDSISEGFIELLADDLDAAEGALRESYDALMRRGARGPLATVAANLARILLLKQHNHEAEELALLCKDIATDSQLDTQIKWRSLLAVVYARRGNADEALQLAKKAAELAERSEQPASQAEAFVDLATVLRQTGQAEQARRYLERALGLHERKGNLVEVARLRRALDEDDGAT